MSERVDVTALQRAAATSRSMIGPGIGMPAAIVLDDFGLLVHDAFGELPYHVGSSLRRKRGWRDVDVRLILDDAAFTALGFGTPSLGSHENPRWVAMVRAFSALGREMTGLPIDFQIQAQTPANERNKGEPRSCLGVHAMLRRQARSEP